MTKYQAAYAHGAESSVGHVTLAAENDDQAIAEVRKIVRTGYRNGTWANVTLSDGRTYGCRNEHGEAVGGYS